MKEATTRAQPGRAPSRPAAVLCCCVVTFRRAAAMVWYHQSPSSRPAAVLWHHQSPSSRPAAALWHHQSSSSRPAAVLWHHRSPSSRPAAMLCCLPRAPSCEYPCDRSARGRTGMLGGDRKLALPERRKERGLEPPSPEGLAGPPSAMQAIQQIAGLASVVPAA